MRKAPILIALFGVAATAAHADSVKFTWVPYSASGPTNNGGVAPATCPPPGPLPISSPLIDSAWATLVGATSGAAGTKVVAGSLGNYTGTAAIQGSGLTAFNFSWGNLPNVATLALGSTLGNVQ